ncbi:J domain-containing protein [Hyphomicrobium sp. LHD-15]|uniref:J domain-containing protein n=1 Tax=Hyphomicrobium sp. LHD-15 TaxID=3072142 RepID=UPI00280DE1C5|nr:J domain-containing protein [Hyphomicrobium sp. LHD-15]MDQ8697308.1 J domain-containing protein [Hyphomicrobium sp. LHD-15]
MPLFRLLGCLLSSIACTLVASSLGARADELLVMPYSCRVAGGYPVLTPSENQGHAVIGRREQREFRACSTENPDMCQRWTVHRFDLDCGGRRVPWTEVVAAAEDVNRGRAFVARDGRLEVEMPPRWSLPPGSPCARERDVEDRRFGRLDEFCAEQLDRARRVTVAMPAGFAPMLGLDGIFVADQAPRGAVADAAPEQPAAERPAKSKPHRSEVPAPQPVPAPKKAETPAAPSAPAPSETKNSADTKVAAAHADRPSEAKAKPEPEKTDPSPALTPSGLTPIIPEIINSGQAPAKAPEKTEVIETNIEVAGSGATAPDPAPTHEHTELSTPPGAAPAGLLSSNMAMISIGAFAALALLGFLFLRRGSDPLLARDISAVSLGANDQPRADRALVPMPKPEANHALTPHFPAGPPVPVSDAMPTTREEAMTILGMGVAPDVNEAAIKKIIDGLRLSWHPDHARDAEDRKNREHRLKQINAAWDIIAGRQAS